MTLSLSKLTFGNEWNMSLKKSINFVLPYIWGSYIYYKTLWPYYVNDSVSLSNLTVRPGYSVSSR